MTVFAPPVPGLLLRDHWIDAPLDHGDPNGTKIRVYAREVAAAEKASDDLPWLLFLQGGPGGKAPRPADRSAWIAQAVGHYRVLLLDQRGTGRSTPVTERTPARLPDAAGLAAYLTNFRADSIIRDAELFRAEVAGGRPWTTLGQSFGGFCTFTYLSFAADGLEKCLVTGGIPGLGASAEEVYRRTWPRVLQKNEEHFRRFPEDRDALHRIRDVITSSTVRLPGGDPLTVPRLQAIGAVLGFSYGSPQLHFLLEEAFADGELSPVFLDEVERRTHHVDTPLYAVLQEACYWQGAATPWAAERVREEHFPEVSPDATDLVLVGEMKESWIYRDEARMQPFADAVALLQAKQDWPALYDPNRLAGNTVPVAAAVYHDDLYVDAGLSLDTAARTPNVRPWVTNEFEHDGLRTSADRVFPHLHDLVTGRA